MVQTMKYTWNVISVVVLLYYKFTISTFVIPLLLQVQQKIGRLAFTCFRYRVGCHVKGTQYFRKFINKNSSTPLSRYFNKLINKSDERKRRSIDNRLTQTYTLPNRANPLGMRPRSFSLSFLFPSIHQSQSLPSHPIPFHVPQSSIHWHSMYKTRMKVSRFKQPISFLRIHHGTNKSCSVFFSFCEKH